MQLLGTTVSFAVLLSLCIFLGAKCRIPSAFTPLIALGAAVLFFTLAGVAGLLLPAAWVFAVGCLGLLVYTLATAREGLAALPTPGFLLFCAAGAAMLLYLGLRQPLFTKWDEFSFWGTAAKLLAQNNALYTTADIGWVWTGTQSPALPLLGWFANVYAGAFAPWRVFWAYDLLLFACGSALLAPVGRGRWRLWVPLGTLVLLFPYLFSVFYHIVHLDVTYMNGYGDLPAGILFGGVLALYYAARAMEKNALALAALPLALFALVKDNVFPIVLVALVVMLADTLLFSPGARWEKARAVLVAAAVPLAAYGVWALHKAWANGQNPSTGGQSTGVSVVDSALSAVRQLLGLEDTAPDFQSTLTTFGEAFADGKNYPVSLFGSLLATVLVILALFALALLLASGRREKQRVALAAGLSAAGFLGYLFIMLVSWGFLFKTEGGALLDYARYLSSYLAGWLLLALAQVVLPLVRVERGAGLPGIAARLSAITAAGALCGVLAAWMPFSLALPAYPDSQLAERRHHAALAEELLGDLPPGTRVFFVDQAGDGQLWFEYSYNALPVVLDYSVSGGSPLTAGGDYQVADAALAAHLAQCGPDAGFLREYLDRYDIDDLLLYSLDEEFLGLYGGLFATMPEEDAPPALYHRGEDGLLRPVNGEES